MENKITKRDNFNSLLAIADVKSNPTLVAFIEHEISLLDKKNASRKSGLTETQKENLVLKDNVLEYLTTNGNAVTCSQIAKEFATSTQKMSPILEKLIADGKVEKEMIKRTNYFKAI